MPEIIAILVAPFQFPFMARALTALICISVAAALIGVLINMRGLEFTADGLAHSVFPGMAVGFVLGGVSGVLPAALVAAIIAAVALTLLARTMARSDAGVAIVFTALFSVGVLIVSQQADFAAGLESLLFGRLLIVTDTALLETAIVCGVVVVIALATMKEQVYRAFDPTMAKAARYPVFALDVLVNVLVAVVVVVASTTIGNLLAIAVLVVPVGCARVLTRRLWFLFPVAALSCGVSSWLGLCIAYGASTMSRVALPASACVVVVLVGLYAFALGGSFLVRARRATRNQLAEAP